MKISSEFHIDEGRLEGAAANGGLEIVIPYTGQRSTEAALAHVPSLAAGLNARVLLVAVHTLPYPLPFAVPTAVHAHLVEQLTELASHSTLPICSQVVLARDLMEGFRHALKPASTVLVGTPRRYWRTQEEKLARTLAQEGHKVALVYST